MVNYYTHVSPHDGARIGVDFKELHCQLHEAIFHRTSGLDGHIIPLLQ